MWIGLHGFDHSDYENNQYHIHDIKCSPFGDIWCICRLDMTNLGLGRWQSSSMATPMNSSQQKESQANERLPTKASRESWWLRVACGGRIRLWPPLYFFGVNRVHVVYSWYEVDMPRVGRNNSLSSLLQCLLRTLVVIVMILNLKETQSRVNGGVRVCKGGEPASLE